MEAKVSIELAGTPRWCVTDAAAERVFLAIRDLNGFGAQLPELTKVEHWSSVRWRAWHGLDHRGHRLYVRMRRRALVEVDTKVGTDYAAMPVAGVPDATSQSGTAWSRCVASLDWSCD